MSLTLCLNMNFVNTDTYIQMHTNIFVLNMKKQTTASANIKLMKFVIIFYIAVLFSIS